MTKESIKDIPIKARKFDDHMKDSVSARDIHTLGHSQQPFEAWVDAYITLNRLLVKHVHYIKKSQFTKLQKQRSTEHYVTIPVASQLAMADSNIDLCRQLDSIGHQLGKVTINYIDLLKNLKALIAMAMQLGYKKDKAIKHAVSVLKEESGIDAHVLFPNSPELLTIRHGSLTYAKIAQIVGFTVAQVKECLEARSAILRDFSVIKGKAYVPGPYKEHYVASHNIKTGSILFKPCAALMVEVLAAGRSYTGWVAKENKPGTYTEAWFEEHSKAYKYIIEEFGEHEIPWKQK